MNLSLYIYIYMLFHRDSCVVDSRIVYPVACHGRGILILSGGNTPVLSDLHGPMIYLYPPPNRQNFIATECASRNRTLHDVSNPFSPPSVSALFNFRKENSTYCIKKIYVYTIDLVKNIR